MSTFVPSLTRILPLSRHLVHLHVRAPPPIRTHTYTRTDVLHPYDAPPARQRVVRVHGYDPPNRWHSEDPCSGRPKGVRTTLFGRRTYDVRRRGVVPRPIVGTTYDGGPWACRGAPTTIGLAFAAESDRRRVGTRVRGLYPRTRTPRPIVGGPAAERRGGECRPSAQRPDARDDSPCSPPRDRRRPGPRTFVRLTRIIGPPGLPAPGRRGSSSPE